MAGKIYKLENREIISNEGAVASCNLQQIWLLMCVKWKRKKNLIKSLDVRFIIAKDILLVGIYFCVTLFRYF